MSTPNGFEPTKRCPHRACPWLHWAVRYMFRGILLIQIIQDPWFLLMIVAMVAAGVLSGSWKITIHWHKPGSPPCQHAVRPAADPVAVDHRWALVAALCDASMLVSLMSLAMVITQLLPMGVALYYLGVILPLLVEIPFRTYAHDRASKPRPRRRRRVRVRNAKPVRTGRLAPVGA